MPAIHAASNSTATLPEGSRSGPRPDHTPNIRFCASSAITGTEPNTHRRRHRLEVNRAVGSFHAGLAARRGHMLGDMTIQRMDNVAIVVDDLDAAVARLRAHGAELLGEVAQYEGIFLLCYLRGPAGIIVALAEQIG